MDQWRIATLGDGGVGKTALAVQIYDPTQEDVYRKQVMVDNRMCFVEVMDTAGQVEYAAGIRDQWLRKSQAFLLVYSIASRSTFDQLEYFRQSVPRIKGGRCYHHTEVSEDEGAALAREGGCEFMETSARTAHNVDRVFRTPIPALRAREPAPPAKSKPTKSRRSCIIL
ncbi:ras protein [Mycena vulgaris]|nr:ras protein [Mycena vulgaris]